MGFFSSLRKVEKILIFPRFLLNQNQPCCLDVHVFVTLSLLVAKLSILAACSSYAQKYLNRVFRVLFYLLMTITCIHPKYITSTLNDLCLRMLSDCNVTLMTHLMSCQAYIVCHRCHHKQQRLSRRQVFMKSISH